MLRSMMNPSAAVFGQYYFAKNNRQDISFAEYGSPHMYDLITTKRSDLEKRKNNCSYNFCNIIIQCGIYYNTQCIDKFISKNIDKIIVLCYIIFTEVRAMANISSAIRDTVSISLFNRGLAGKIFDDVKQSGAKVVMKNNAAECVLMSPDEYIKLMDEVNDARLLTVANARMQNFNKDSLVSGKELYEELGITKEDLDSIGEVEIE